MMSLPSLTSSLMLSRPIALKRSPSRFARSPVRCGATRFSNCSSVLAICRLPRFWRNRAPFTSMPWPSLALMYDDSQRFHGTAAATRDHHDVLMKPLPATALRATGRERLRCPRLPGSRNRCDLRQQLGLDRGELAVAVVPSVLDAVTQEAALLDRLGDRHLRPATGGLELRVLPEVR